MTRLTLGPNGSLAHEASTLLFPKKKVIFASSMDELFFRLSDKEITEGIIPIEIGEVFIEDAISHLMKYDFSITRKIIFPLCYSLAGKGKNLTHLYGHPAAFEECRTKLHDLCPGIKRMHVPTMGHAALRLKAERDGAGAIVTPFAAKCYDLPILTQEIADQEELYAMFFAIGKKAPMKKPSNGSAFLIFSEPMATVGKQLADQARELKVPLIKLKNLLLQEGHTPLYFMEVEGHIEERGIRTLFESLSSRYLIKHLGSYPL
jgi:prephenate dehydratase